MSGTFYTRTEGRPAQQRKAIVRFHTEAVEDVASSAREGRQIWKNEERVQFIMPGSPNQPVERVTDWHRQEWPEEYAAFKRGEEMSANGIPLEQWPALTKAQVQELKHLNIYTVEACADLSDVATQKIGIGGRKIRDLAKAYLDDAYAQAELQKVTNERDRQAAEIAELRGQVSELSRLLNSVHGQLTALQNRPSEIATYVPGQHDPVSIAVQVQGTAPAAASSLGDLPAPRRRGRPPNSERAAEEAA